MRYFPLRLGQPPAHSELLRGGQNMVEERKEIWEKRPTPRMVIPGKICDGHLDLFLLEAVSRAL